MKKNPLVVVEIKQRGEIVPHINKYPHRSFYQILHYSRWPNY